MESREGRAPAAQKTVCGYHCPPDEREAAEHKIREQQSVREKCIHDIISCNQLSVENLLPDLHPAKKRRMDIGWVIWH